MSSQQKQATFIPKSLTADSLSNKPEQGKHLLEPFKSFAAENNIPVNVLENSSFSPGDPEVHRHEADFWYCLEGEITFVVGGIMIEPWAKQLQDGGEDTREIKAKDITEGAEHVLTKGDMLYIPAGVPHVHRTKEGQTARLVIIKVPEPEFPLSDVPGWK